MDYPVIAVLGGGNMANALIACWVAGGYPADKIEVHDHNFSKLERLQKLYGVTPRYLLGKWLRSAEVVLLAVKPQQLADLLEDVKDDIRDASVLSIAAGVRIDDLKRLVTAKAYCRAMPNTPVRIAQGVTGIYAPKDSAEFAGWVKELLTPCGSVVVCSEESQMDAVTALSGSGPAYVFRFLEAMEESAAAYGFSGEDARNIVLQTVFGAASLARTESAPFAELRERVTSKGGTTYAALTKMEEGHFAQTLQEGIKAADKRSAELADAFHEGLSKASEK
jgi:pyrroline-5-carboxylate reductase